MFKRKLFVFVLLIMCFFTFVGCDKTTDYSYYQTKVEASLCTKTDSNVYLGGFACGFTLGVGGLQVIGICDVITKEGNVAPAKDSGIAVGDKIISIDGQVVNSIGQLDSILAEGNEKLSVVINRNNQTKNITICPAKDVFNGKNRLGILVRDCVAGVGTITYIDVNTHRFASLGHPVLDENNEYMKILSQDVYKCSIIGVTKGVRGKAGELKGLFINDKSVAVAQKNIETGIYGTFNDDFDYSSLTQVSVAKPEEIKIGSAKLITTIDGVTPQEYNVQIAKVDLKNSSKKNYVVKISDKKLLEQTGGIVQGMSGSPILQNGKLIGAITHVFVNDPTRGFGISIDNMMGN